MAKHTILCVDDELGIVDALERIFRSKYNVLKATSGHLALELLAKHPDITVIITDQRMPNMNGTELLSRSLLTHANAVRILLTGFTDVQSVVQAINSGEVYRYVTKPWDPTDLLNAVDRAVEKFELTATLREKNLALELALNELRSLDQMKNEFMILINHELKTPLTGVLSFVELLKETKLDSEQQLFVKRITQASDRLKQLVDDTLFILSAEGKILKIKSQRFTSQELNKRIKAEILNELSKKQLSLDILWVKNELVGDVTLIADVISRLVDNAMKFAVAGSKIYLHCKLMAPHKVQISIANEGPQIPVELLEKIITPFFINENILNHSQGAGLGLSVCQAILKAHQSELFLQNTDSGVIAYFEISAI